jgi:hypothetical protein
MTDPYAVDALVPNATEGDVAAWDRSAKIALWFKDEPVWSDVTLAELVDSRLTQTACRVGKEVLWQDGYGRFFNSDGVQVFPRRDGQVSA